MRLLEKSDIPLANSKVSISFVLRQLGMPDPDYAASGAKSECPFGDVFHPDGQKSFRVYDDVGAYCFACGQRWDAVSLYAQAKDLSPDDAAAELLEKVGYRKPTAEERFEFARVTPPEVDTHALSETLKIYCQRNYPLWEVLQFDDKVARKFRQCVELLPSVHTAEETKTWLTVTKQAMSKVLEEATS